MKLHLDAPGCEFGGQWQTCPQILRAIRDAWTELSQADAIAVEAGDDLSIRARFERDVRVKAGEQHRSAPSIIAASVPIPKFVSSCGKLICEFRNRRILAKL
jgi:hypothetical protein